MAGSNELPSNYYEFGSLLVRWHEFSIIFQIENVNVSTRAQITNRKCNFSRKAIENQMEKRKFRKIDLRMGICITRRTAVQGGWCTAAAGLFHRTKNDHWVAKGESRD